MHSTDLSRGTATPSIRPWHTCVSTTSRGPSSWPAHCFGEKAILVAILISTSYTDAGFRQRVQRWFDEVPVEIFVNPEAAVLGYLDSEAKSGRLFTAHMLSTGVPLVVQDGARLERLLEEASAALSRPPHWDEASLTRARYAAATLVEDALDCWERDQVTAHHLLSKGIDSCLAYWYMSQGRNIPRNKEIAAQVTRSDPELGELLRRFFRSTEEEERWESGLCVADRVLSTRGFFEWESEREPI